MTDMKSYDLISNDRVWCKLRALMSLEGFCCDPGICAHLSALRHSEN